MFPRSYSLILIALYQLSSCRSANNSHMKDQVVVGGDGRSFFVYGQNDHVIVRECPVLEIIDTRQDVDGKCPKTDTNESSYAVATFKDYLIKAMTNPSVEFLKYLSTTAKNQRETYATEYDAAVKQKESELNTSLDSETKAKTALDAEIARLRGEMKRIEDYQKSRGNAATGSFLVDLERLKAKVSEVEAEAHAGGDKVALTQALLAEKNKLVGPVKAQIDAMVDAKQFSVVVPQNELGFVSGFVMYLTQTKTVSVAAGSHHTCSLMTTGEVVCWGTSYQGEGSEKNFGVVKLPEAATSLSAGPYYTCAVLISGKVFCWGTIPLYNKSNDAGIIPLSDKALMVSTDAYDACALLQSGKVECWGQDNHGEQRPNTGGNSIDIVPLSEKALSVSSKGQHGCAVLTSGKVSCWASNDDTRLRGTSENGGIVHLLDTAESVSAGRFHTCALLTSGKVTCWGDEGHSQLGPGKNFSIVPLPENAKSISAGHEHTCAVLTSGKVTCWGKSWALGTKKNFEIVPLSESAKSVSAGDEHTCAVLISGKVTCWGSNILGQRGTADFEIVPLAPQF